jgi:hypothetical protein
LEKSIIGILKSKDKVFCDLIVEAEAVPEDVLACWMSKNETLHDWHETFLAVKEGDEPIISATDFDSRFLEVQQSELFKTPGNTSVGASSSLLSAFSLYPSYFRTSGVRDLFKLNPAPSKLGESVAALDEGLVSLSSSFSRLLSETQRDASPGADTTKMLDIRIMRLSNLVGSIDEMEESDYASPTVWASVVAIAADVQVALKRKATPPTVDLGPVYTKITAVEGSMQTVSSLLKNQVLQLGNLLGTRVGGVEKAIARLRCQSGSTLRPVSTAPLVDDRVKVTVYETTNTLGVLSL